MVDSYERNGKKYWLDDEGYEHPVPKEDLRQKWKEGLTPEQLEKAILALDTIFEGMAIGGPLYGDEVRMVEEAKRDWKEVMPSLDYDELINNYAYFGYPEGSEW